MHIEGPPWLGSYSVDQHTRLLKGHPGWGLLCSSVFWVFDGPGYCSAANAGMLQGAWSGGGYGDGSTPYAWLSNITAIASMAAQLSPTGISHHSLFPHIPSIHLSAVNSSPCPGIVPQSLNSSSQLLCFQETYILVRGMYGCGKDCLIPIPFRLQLTHQLFDSQPLMFLLWLRQLPRCGDQTPPLFPHPPRAGPVLLTLLFSPLVPSFYRVLCSSMLFSTGQVLLSALSWCSACTSVSEGVFLMYPWREMYSTSTYSSDILFSGYMYFLLLLISHLKKKLPCNFIFNTWIISSFFCNLECFKIFYYHLFLT